MHPQLLFIVIFVHSVNIQLTETYRTFSMLDLGSCSRNSVAITMESMTQNSSGILVSSLNNAYKPGLHCIIFLRPPMSYGIVISIKKIDLGPPSRNYEDCQTYLELTSVARSKTKRLCGYSDDKYEFKAFYYGGELGVVFHTSNSTWYKNAFFQLTFTAVRKGNGWCFKEEALCLNNYCIWKGLLCDGHNNCGDLSDEVDKKTSHCGSTSAAESLAVIVVTIICSLVLLFISAYLRGSKITTHIRRMSRCRRSGCEARNGSIPENEASSENTNTPQSSPTRIRDRFGSTRRLLDNLESNSCPYPSCDDPPPPYEAVRTLEIVPTSCSVIIAHTPVADTSVS